MMTGPVSPASQFQHDSPVETAYCQLAQIDQGSSSDGRKQLLVHGQNAWSDG